jgi:E3 Ubiquitin ligase
MPVATFLSSRPENLLVFAAIGAIAGVYWFVRGFRLLQRKRLILNTPTSKIRSASMGLVEISGLATSPYVMTSPLKQAQCYYYRSVAWQLKQQGKKSEWEKVAEESLHVPFYVDDGSGKVLVEPRGAEMDLHCDLQQEYHRSVLFSGPEMPGWVAEFLTRHGVDPDKRIKVAEYCIKPKNFLFVLGTLSQNPGLDASVTPAWAERRDHAQVNDGLGSRHDNGDGVVKGAQIIKLSTEGAVLPATAMTQQGKIAAALTKAGISNSAAWNAAGVGVKTARAEQAVSSPQTVAVEPAFATEQQLDSDEAEGFDLHPPVVLMQGSHQPAFFISWRSQRDVVKLLGWKSDLMIWGGPALTLGCIYFLLEHFGWL